MHNLKDDSSFQSWELTLQGHEMDIKGSSWTSPSNDVAVLPPKTPKISLLITDLEGWGCLATTTLLSKAGSYTWIFNIWPELALKSNKKNTNMGQTEKWEAGWRRI